MSGTPVHRARALFVVIAALIGVVTVIGSPGVARAEPAGGVATAPGWWGSVGAGDDFTCVLGDDATIRCFGYNANGALGLGHTDEVGPHELLPVVLPAGRTTVAVDAGGDTGCALLDDGTAYCWGGNEIGLVEPPGTTVMTSISVGTTHVCATLDTGDAGCWGYNNEGELGDGTTDNRFDTFATVDLGDRTVTAISAGDQLTCALLDNGRLSCWGTNTFNEAFGTSANQLTPSAPSLVDGQTVTAVAAATSTVCAIVADGTMRCWGAIDRPGIGTPIPIPGAAPDFADFAFPGAPTLAGVAANNFTYCGLTDGGTVYCAGENDQGQTGSGVMEDFVAPSKTEAVVTTATTVAMTMGQTHSCAIADDGVVRCWGANWDGQLGMEPADTFARRPIAPVGTPLADIDQLAPFQLGMCALVAGAVYCNGTGISGTLGTGSADAVDDWRLDVPTPLPTGRTATQLEARLSTACALLDNGTVACWGDNDAGRANGVPGSASVVETPTVVPIPGNPTVVDVAVGEPTVCALTDAGAIRCWGENTSGLLGNGGGDPFDPVTLPVGRTATAIEAGGRHMCAELDDNSVVCWGSNASGQLGIGSTGGSADTPQPVINAVDTVALELGSNHTCVRRFSGLIGGTNGLFCVGRNFDGQLGLGDTTDRDEISTSEPTSSSILIGGVAVGNDHTCVRFSGPSPTVHCTGANYEGQIGLGNADTSQITTLQLTQELGGTPMALFAGAQRTCVGLDDGTTNCWGYAPGLDTSWYETETRLIGEPLVAGESGVPATIDADRDGVLDTTDNCPATPNPGQADLDGDGIGDACDTLQDNDGDGVANSADNCPNTANADQADADGDGIGDVCDPTPNPEPEPDAEVFTSLTPARYADSRDEDTFDDQFRNTGIRAADSTWEIQIADRGDVPADAAAAIVNLTIVNGQAPGFATVYPCGDLPLASSANYGPGDVEPNELIAKLSPTGTLCVYTFSAADVIVDVVGYVSADSPYVPVEPARFADSRDQDTFDDQFRNTGIRAADSTWEIQIADRGDVSPDATAAVINLTVTGGLGEGFATVYPCGDLPLASSLNYGPGITRPNELIAKLSDTGSLCVYTFAAVEVIVDVVGYLEASDAYTPITPTRYADSRDEPTFDTQFRDTGIRAHDTTWEIDIAGRGEVPADATSATINLTVTGAPDFGFATVHPCGELPLASSINYGPGVTRPNELVAKLSPTGTICVYTFGATHVIVDVVGHNGTP